MNLVDLDDSQHGTHTLDDLNGKIKSSLNGHAVASRRKTQSRKSPTLMGRSISLSTRLLIWYSIITILFRCPASLDAADETSPRICKPYFQVKDVVSPTIAPYYDAYAAPYVDLVQPYYEKLDNNVLTPARGYAVKYGAPRVAQAQAYGRAQWEKSVQPQLLNMQKLAQTQYQQSIAPYTSQATAALAPYTDIARTNALQTYYQYLLPTYQAVQPYASQAYLASSAYAVSTAWPAIAWAGENGYGFLNRTIWPQLRVIYVEAVEPQLHKIGERLGRYSDKTATAPEGELSATKVAAVSSFLKPTPSATTSFANASVLSSAAASVASQIKSATAIIPGVSVSDEKDAETSAKSSSAAAAKDTEPANLEEEFRKTPPAGMTVEDVVAEDLKNWQDRYAKAADESGEEIEERVEEISNNMISQQAHAKGKPLVAEFASVVDVRLAKLKTDLQSSIQAVVEGSKTGEDAKTDITSAVRGVGMEIKQKAQSIRSWRQSYDAQLRQEVTKAAESHFRILDGIRDLALQKIGIKWAWLDGITYKHWAKYHALKDKFEEWQADIDKQIVTHPGLEKAQVEGQAVEEDAMDIASAAAKELARLKQVGFWKLEALDASDDFDSESTEKKAAEAASAQAEEVDQGVDPASEVASKIASSVLEPEADATSEAVNLVSGDNAEAKTALTDAISETLTEAASSVAGAASSVASEASESASSLVHPSSSEAIPTSAEPLAASSPILLETPIIPGNTTDFVESEGEAPIQLPDEEELDRPDDLPLESSAADTATVKPALFGAAAQKVSGRKPILEDYEDAIESAKTDVPSSISSVAHSAYSQAMSQAAQQYSHALSIVSAQIKGTPAPVHERMLASVTSAYSNAMASASSRLDDVVKSAQGALGSTPSPTGVLPSLSMPSVAVPSFDWSAIEAIAAERLAQGQAWAQENYESAKIAIGLATPTPSTPSEHVDRLLQNAKYNYYAGLGMAQARYTEFLAAASSAVSSMTATPTPTDLSGTASSVASVASASAASAASVASSGASSAASVVSSGASSAASVVSSGASSAASAVSSGASSAASVVSENASSVASVVGETISSAAAAGYDTVVGAGAAVQDNYEVIVSKISIQIYGQPTPTPWYQGLYDAAGGYAAGAGDYAASATDAAAKRGAEVTSAAGTYASSAADHASSQLAAYSKIVSELLIGKEPSFSESVYSRISAAYTEATASAASVASVVSEGAAEATDKVKKSVGKKDEL